MRVKKTVCNLCGKKVVDTSESKAEHMYYEHPLQALGKVLQSVPQLQNVGSVLGTMLKKGIENAR